MAYLGGIAFCDNRTAEAVVYGVALNSLYLNGATIIGRRPSSIHPLSAKGFTGVVADALGVPMVGVFVAVYDKTSKQLAATTVSGPGGTYSVHNLLADREYFIVCLDPSGDLDASAHDRLSPGE